MGASTEINNQEIKGKFPFVILVIIFSLVLWIKEMYGIEKTKFDNIYNIGLVIHS